METYQNTVYTVDSLAARWMCSQDVIYDLLRRKELNGFKIGSAWRISADAVSRFENNE